MERLPCAMMRYHQFIIYKLENSKSLTGKMDKIPLNAFSLRAANAHDPAMWMTAVAAIERLKQLGAGYGIGFVFTENDPFFFLDIDNCFDGREWSPLARGLLAAFKGAAIEVSASKKGLHIFGTGVVPPHTCRNTQYGLELYTSGRFVALTGIHAAGDADLDCSEALRSLVEDYFSTIALIPAGVHEWTTEACEGWNGSNDDDEIIRRALLSRSAAKKFGGEGASFADLWDANIETLSKAYPDTGGKGRAYDESQADAALAQHLAFWTGNNCERIERLMRRSELVREKWDKHTGYLPLTIQGACGRQKTYLNDRPREDIKPAPPDQPKPERVNGSTLLNIDTQIEYFAGCVYVREENKIMVPGGYLFTREQFRADRGGFTFQMDNLNQRTTRNAFEAFTESQGLRAPRVDSTCFVPTEKPGSIIEMDGQRLVNIYFPILTPRVKGDISFFKTHLDLLIGENEDQLILISYMAALLRYPGVKFQWCPLIQGTEGNGKTFLTRIIAYAIGRRYCHFPKASEIDSRFNDWLFSKLFIAVEDVYFPDNRREVMEILKPMVTNERQEIEGKGLAKVTKDICANFILNTNHKDGLRKHRGDRRFAPFFTRQQSVEDLKRDGMLDTLYFRDLYKQAKEGGYSSAAYYLENFDIPDKYNPATFCNRAPRTESTEEAVKSSLGRVEQEVMDHVDREEIGFRGGWISSTYFDRLLKSLQVHIHVRRRYEILRSLGYDYHPALSDGKAPGRMILPDGARSRLYIIENHKDKDLREPKDVAIAYTLAQADE